MERVQTKLRNGEKGFTLVELAIVMIIIGLLITGILKGQEMIANAQVTSTVAEIKALDAAMSTFRDTFNSPPGDMINAAVRLPAACTLTCVIDGNGDGQISVNPGAIVAGEGLAAFTQMGAIDLISGVNPTPVDAVVNVGDEVPEASVTSASFRLGFVANVLPTGSQGGALTTWRGGHYLAVGGLPGVAVGGTIGGEGLTPIQAGRIDGKLDDGNPIQGVVRGGGQAVCISATNYNAGGTNQANCSVFVRIQG